MLRAMRLPCIAWIVALLTLITSNAILDVDAKRILISTMPGGPSHILEIIPVANHLINDMGHEVGLLIEDWDLEKARAKLPPPPPNGDKSPSFVVVSPFANMDDGRLNFEKQVKASKGEFISVSRKLYHHSSSNIPPKASTDFSYFFLFLPLNFPPLNTLLSPYTLSTVSKRIHKPPRRSMQTSFNEQTFNG